MQNENEKLAELYPPFATLIKSFLFEARKNGFSVGLFEGLRSFERQGALYLQGRDGKGAIIDKSKIVTWAKPGRSFHQYGLAVDIVFDARGDLRGYQWAWDDTYPWNKLGLIGGSMGLDAGVFWSQGKKDPPHYQKSYGLDRTQMFELYQAGGLKSVWERLKEV